MRCARRASPSCWGHPLSSAWLRVPRIPTQLQQCMRLHPEHHNSCSPVQLKHAHAWAITGLKGYVCLVRCRHLLIARWGSATGRRRTGGGVHGGHQARLNAKRVVDNLVAAGKTL